MAQTAAKPGAATLGLATHTLFSAKLLAAQGSDPSQKATQALAGYRKSRAPWWIAKTLTLLATPGALAEAAEIEQTSASDPTPRAAWPCKLITHAFVDEVRVLIRQKPKRHAEVLLLKRERPTGSTKFPGRWLRSPRGQRGHPPRRHTHQAERWPRAAGAVTAVD